MISSRDSLVVVLYGRRTGRLDRESGGGASFTYDPEHLVRVARPQLSMRLPLREATFPSARTLPFLDGLLPENREARQESARARGVPDDPLSLLSVMGWDCPGAVQITPEDQVEQMLSREGGLEPVTDQEIGARIAACATTRRAGRCPRSTGRWPGSKRSSPSPESGAPTAPPDGPRHSARHRPPTS